MTRFRNPIELPYEASAAGNYFFASYPPFSTWSARELPELKKALEEPSPGDSLLLYVHIPFCPRRCGFCCFRIHPGSKASTIDLYIDALLDELLLYRLYDGIRKRRLTSVYFGGGTPSSLTTDQIRRLLEGMQEILPWDGVVDCTFECDPLTISLEKLQALRELGVTRVSLGFHSLSPRALEDGGRGATARMCIESFRLARKAGFTEINVDLLAGLPSETDKSWMDTARRVADLGPGCITIHQLAPGLNSAFRAREEADPSTDLPGWPEKRRWVDRAFRALEERGYAIVSGRMAIRDPECRRFVSTVDRFWHGADLLALGETAFGHIRGVHYQNADTLDDYILLLGQGQLPLQRARRLTDEESLRRETILQLERGELDAAYFRTKYGVEIREKFRDPIERLQMKGLLETFGDSIRLTREGLLQADRLLPEFYLEEHRGKRCR